VRRLVVIAFLVAACRGGSSKQTAGSGAPGSAAVLPEGPYATLAVDGAKPAVVTVSAPTSLATLVPATPAWFLVEAQATDGRFLELQTPATTYPGAEVRLYVRDGRLAIGVYRPPVTEVPPAVAELAAQPVVELTNVVEINVWTKPPPKPPSEVLTIEVPGRPPRELDREELAKLTEVHERRARGWLLRDLITYASPGARPASVRVIGSGGEEVVSAEQLAKTALIKRNQKGELVFQLWEPAKERATVQVRGVTRLVVTK
jgi:hypothetical protein